MSRDINGQCFSSHIVYKVLTRHSSCESDDSKHMQRQPFFASFVGADSTVQHQISM